MKNIRLPHFAIILTLIALCILTLWALPSLTTSNSSDNPSNLTTSTLEKKNTEKNTSNTKEKQYNTNKSTQNNHQIDDTLLKKSLEKGYIPTQESGELGSREGKIFTTIPMQYPKTKYEYLPDSPLIKFTNDMVWEENGEFKILKDAAFAQANTIQESSIALSVSERIIGGKLNGFQIVEVPPNTLFAKLGIVSGDVILTINGGKPDMEPVALHFVNMLALHGSAEIELEHRGQTRTIKLRAVE